MHELSICQQLLKQANEIASQNNAERITAIHLTLGPLSGVDSHLLKQAYKLASQHGLTRHAILNIKESSIVVKCEQCAAVCDATPNRLRCSCCGSPETHLISGDELVINSIDIEASNDGLLTEVEHV